MNGPQKSVYYGKYLQLDKLLDCQQRESAIEGKPAHDEMLFIIVHQAYELWFKQVLFELDSLLQTFSNTAVDEVDMGRIVAGLRRITEIQKLLIQQIDVLETMTPLDFLDFRDYLVPASGFQSTQFRLIERRLGLRMEDRLSFGEAPYYERLQGADRDILKEAEESPTLFDYIQTWLERTPFLEMDTFSFWQSYKDAVENMIENDRAIIKATPTLSEGERESQLLQLEKTRREFEVIFDEDTHTNLMAEGSWRLSHKALKAALFINLYRDQPVLHLPYQVLSLLMDIDENFTTWRYRHSLMVLRMIGQKIGTGGSSGHDYLRQTAKKHKVFKDFFALSTFFLPRSALPELPPEAQKKLGFHFQPTAA